jgi:hypothetical protein
VPSPVSYLPQEIRSYLPSGWDLTSETGRFDPKRGKWRISVLDGAENEWDLEVASKDADQLGRMPALRRAMDHLYRSALG